MCENRKITIEGPINKEGTALLQLLVDMVPNIPVNFSESEVLRYEASQKESDLAYMGGISRALRAARLEDFKAELLPLLEKAGASYQVGNHKYTFFKGVDVYDFYPKKNSLLIRSENEWKRPGKDFLIKLYKEELKLIK